MESTAAPLFEGDELLHTYLGLRGPADMLVNRITLTVAREIIEGRVAPGMTLDSLTLAKQFQTSRTPVREALIALQQQGLIEIEARRRPRVVVLSDDTIEEIYELRAELHALIAAKVARAPEPSRLDELDEKLELMRSAVAADDVDAFFWGNVAFHERAASIANDATLMRVVYGLGLQVLRLRHASMSVPGQMARSLADHERLMVAYREHDAGVAAALSRTLILRALSALEFGAAGA